MISRAVIVVLGLIIFTIQPATAQDAQRVARIGSGCAVRAEAVAPGSRRCALALPSAAIEGRSYILLQRYAEGALDRVPELAAELLKENVDLIVSQGRRYTAFRRW